MSGSAKWASKKIWNVSSFNNKMYILRFVCISFSLPYLIGLLYLIRWGYSDLQVRIGWGGGVLGSGPPPHVGFLSGPIRVAGNTPFCV